MTCFVPSRVWQRMALGAFSSVTALAVLAGSLLLFSDGPDRAWIAAALGVGPGVPAACLEVPSDACALRVAANAAASSAPAAAR